MGDYHISMQFDVEADPASVRQALTTRDGLASWWSARVDSPSEARWDVWFPDVPQPFELDVARDDPERVEWRVGEFPPPWQGTSIRWDLAANPEGPGTRLVFSHRDFEPTNPVIPVVTPAWAQIILRLKGYAETGTPDPFFAQ